MRTTNHNLIKPMPRLVAELNAQFAESAKLESTPPAYGSAPSSISTGFAGGTSLA